MNTLPITLIYLAGFLLLGWMVWMLWQMRAKGAPFWPTDRRRVRKMLDLVEIQPTDRVVDLGSGDGRLVIAAAERGAAQSVGYELDSFWFNVSRDAQRKSPHANRIEFIQKSFWEIDLSQFTVVFLYQGKHILKPLTEKLRSELPPSARIVSNSFPLPKWEAERETSGAYLYVIKR